MEKRRKKGGKKASEQSSYIFLSACRGKKGSSMFRGVGERKVESRKKVLT